MDDERAYNLGAFRNLGALVAPDGGAAMVRPWVVLLALILLANSAGSEPAQIAGKVTWLSGGRMTVAVPVQQFGQRGSVTIDVSDVPQSDLSDIRSGDQVVIYGDVLDERFIAGRVIKRTGR